MQQKTPRTGCTRKIADYAPDVSWSPLPPRSYSTLDASLSIRDGVRREARSINGDELTPFQGVFLVADGNHLVPQIAGPSKTDQNKKVYRP